LEQQGKLKNRFKMKFRRRPAWKLEPMVPVARPNQEPAPSE